MESKYKNIAGVLLSIISNDYNNAIRGISYLWRHENIDMWEFLFENGLHQKRGSDNNNFFALAEAVKNNDMKLVSFLLGKEVSPFFEINGTYIEKGTCTQKKVKKTIGMLAVETGFDMVKFLINKNKMILAHESSEGETMLSWAVKNDNLEFAKYLIVVGAFVKQNYGGIDGNYPIHSAVRYRNYEMIKLLVENGADVNVTNARNESVLHIAFDCHGSVGERFEIIKYLCNLSVNPNTKAKYSKGGFTAFDTAMDYKKCILGEESKQQYQDIADFLKNYEKEYNSRK